ncbi:MAG TPA: hypothetical protein VJN96_19810 [Vicinamibacterales bacterium]|nr:hypothetical protein [Vicinamibacterales bacterium]
MDHRIVRFDVRLNNGDYLNASWDKARRDSFLLKPDVEWPLSVDPLVWPSVFYSAIFREAVDTSYSSIEVPPSTDGGKYWLNLDRMTAHYDRHKKTDTSGVMVAIELFFPEALLVGDVVHYEQLDGIQCGIWLDRTIPAELPSGCALLGYDVADAGWISGLTNCGYVTGEKEPLARAWATRLNQFGLLSSLEDALEFKRMTDERVKEHSPFWVYGIWQVSGSVSAVNAWQA